MSGIGLVERLRAAGCVFADDEAAALEKVACGAALEELVRRRVRGEPLEYLVGSVDFAGQAYRLSRGVFIPRQRSAFLVEQAAGLGGTVILDLCCGCGALGLAIRGRLDPAVELVAVDVCPDAVADAHSNGVADAFVGDLFDAVPSSLRGRVDLLVANAPYVPSEAVAQMPRESREYEPLLSVDGGPDGLAVQRRILAQAPAWLSPTGSLLTETSRSQAAALAVLARTAGLQARMVRDEGRGATVLIATLPVATMT